MGRPRLSVDFAIILRMRDVEKLGWSQMAEAYRKVTGQYISRDTIKRRSESCPAACDSSLNSCFLQPATRNASPLCI